MKVLIPQDITAAGKDYLKEKGYEVIVGSGSSVDIICKEVADCDAILARTAPFPAEVFDAGKKVKVIARHGIGVDNIDVDACTKRGIFVTNAPLSNANSVAEQTIAFLMALSKNLIRVDKAFRAGDFEIRNKLKGMDLEGKTLGILGLGRIGRLVAKKAGIGLDMNVIGYDPFVNESNKPEGVSKLASLEDVLKESDFVTLHMPLTPETKASMGMARFSMMKKTAYFVNMSRGEVVNEKELIEALKNGVIAGAALDVFEQEPTEKDNPLLSMENVVVTPHNAALTQESMDRMGLHAAIGIDEVLSGKAPSWPVNKPEGK